LRDAILPITFRQVQTIASTLLLITLNRTIAETKIGSREYLEIVTLKHLYTIEKQPLRNIVLKND
jgi:hypothetical protein